MVIDYEIYLAFGNIGKQKIYIKKMEFQNISKASSAFQPNSNSYATIPNRISSQINQIEIMNFSTIKI